MNQLLIIGNGFDLAHGLKTRYTDFLLWYLNRFCKQCKLIKSNTYEDNLAKIVYPGTNNKAEEFNSIHEFDTFIGDKNTVDFSFRSDFFRDIKNELTNQKWVDIEYLYYHSLLDLYNRFEESNPRAKKTILNKLKSLNISLETIKQEFLSYLSDTYEKPNNTIRRIKNHIQSMHGKLNKADKMIILNFNYTDTIELYATKTAKIDIFNIHGKLGDNTDRIIFGYGDEMDEYYSKIERLNINEFLMNFKSFGYFKSENYRLLTSLLEDRYFRVSIMGHSCGISDRILLNTIFEHENCNRIEIFYHQKDDGSNDYFEKTLEISRHFSPSGKKDMRNKIVPFDESKPLVG